LVPTCRPAEKGESFFEFVREFCLDEGRGIRQNRALHRLCSLMRKMEVETVVVEELPLSHTSVARETSALQSVYSNAVDIKAHRFTFLSQKITKAKEALQLPDRSFLSSAVLINFTPHSGDPYSYLFRAVVALPRYKHIIDGKSYYSLLLNNYFHIYKTFDCEVGVDNGDETHRFTITGTVFHQQNGVTSVCAHAAVCMAVNNQNLHPIRVIEPEDINFTLGIDHMAVRLKEDKEIYHADVEKVLRDFNVSIIEPPKVDDYLYNYLESRCPVLLVFTTGDDSENHIIPIFGHTLNSDMWTPEAELAYSKETTNRFRMYKSSFSWVDHFLIHDDNFGMYYCLPVQAIKKPIPGKHRPLRADFAMLIVPRNVSITPREAERASMVVLTGLFERLRAERVSFDPWTDTIARSRPIITRTLLLTKEEYSESLDKTDFDNKTFSARDRRELTKGLPPRFWLCEITMPDIYTANHAKVIDFFYRCDDSIGRRSSVRPTARIQKRWIEKRWIQIRFPGVLYRRNPSSVVKLSVKSHYPLFQFPTDQSIPAW